jgi:hypothetical protein
MSFDIQMDQVPPHTGNDNINQLNEHCQDNLIDVAYTTQPAQSPDLNINYLCIFNALQKRTDHLKDQGDKTLAGLWIDVKQAFKDFPKETIQVCYGHLYANYNMVIRHRGCNKYKSPHARVRVKFDRGQPLNECCLAYDDFVALREETREWLRRNP